MAAPDRRAQSQHRLHKSAVARATQENVLPPAPKYRPEHASPTATGTDSMRTSKPAAATATEQ